jgi:hypothetical protein
LGSHLFNANTGDDRDASLTQCGNAAAGHSRVGIEHADDDRCYSCGKNCFDTGTSTANMTARLERDDQRCPLR